MPYRRRNYSRKPYTSYRRKTYRKGKRNARGRFARKTFRKSMTLRAGLYIPRQAYVKLPFTSIIQVPQLTTGANWTLGIWGNGLTCPLSINPSGNPSVGDKYPLGLEQYSSFYQYYKVLGASCKVQINNGTTISGDSVSTSNASYYCALLSAQGTPYDTDTDSNWYKMANSDTENLISFPGCSWRLVSNSVGSRSNQFLKRWTKTKSILGVKDVKDIDDLQGYLPGSESDFPNGRNPSQSDAPNGGSDHNWFFMLRIDPNIAATIPANAVSIVLKVKYYVQLYGRDFNNQGVVPE